MQDKMTKRKTKLRSVFHISLDLNNELTIYFFIKERNFEPYIDFAFLAACGLGSRDCYSKFNLVTECEMITSRRTPPIENGQRRKKVKFNIAPLKNVFQSFPDLKHRIKEGYTFGTFSSLKIQTLIEELSEKTRPSIRFIEPFFTREILPRIRFYAGLEGYKYTTVRNYGSEICSYDVFCQKRMCLLAFETYIKGKKCVYITFTLDLRTTIANHLKNNTNRYFDANSLNRLEDIFFISIYKQIDSTEELCRKKQNSDLNLFRQFILEKAKFKSIKRTFVGDEYLIKKGSRGLRRIILETDQWFFLDILEELKNEQNWFSKKEFIFLDRKKLENVLLQYQFESC